MWGQVLLLGRAMGHITNPPSSLPPFPPFFANPDAAELMPMRTNFNEEAEELGLQVSKGPTDHAACPACAWIMESCIPSFSLLTSPPLPLLPSSPAPPA